MSRTDTKKSGIEVQLDTSLCAGYGTCTEILPEVFDLSPGHNAPVLLQTILAHDQRVAIEEAVQNCPAQAISIRIKTTD